MSIFAWLMSVSMSYDHRSPLLKLEEAMPYFQEKHAVHMKAERKQADKKLLPPLPSPLLETIAIVGKLTPMNTNELLKKNMMYLLMVSKATTTTTTTTTKTATRCLSARWSS